MERQARRRQLTSQAQEAIATIYRRAPWVMPSEADVDVAIIGGGQSGVGIAFALTRAGMTRCQVFDAAPEGAAGAWLGQARMETLRTEKVISGLDQGIPELAFRSWFDALQGPGAFEALDRIPTLVWADYCNWLRDVFAVSVLYRHSLVAIERDGAGLGLVFKTPEGDRRMIARRIVLATGIDGWGGSFVPSAIWAAVPRHRYDHTGDAIDFSRFLGRKLVVVGAASSAFDAAATALEAGAAEVHLLARGETLATQSPLALAKNPVLYRPFRDLSDAVRWQLITNGRARGHAPSWTVGRASRHENFFLHLGADIDAIGFEDDKIVVNTPTFSVAADHLIAATGYVAEPSLRPELAVVAPLAKLWRDRPGIVAQGSDWCSATSQMKG